MMGASVEQKVVVVGFVCPGCHKNETNLGNIPWQKHNGLVWHQQCLDRKCGGCHHSEADVPGLPWIEGQNWHQQCLPKKKAVSVPLICHYCDEAIVTDVHVVAKGITYHNNCYNVSRTFNASSKFKFNCLCGSKQLTLCNTNSKCSHRMCFNCAEKHESQGCVQCKENDAIIAEQKRKVDTGLYWDKMYARYMLGVIITAIITLLIYPVMIHPIASRDQFGWVFLRILEGVVASAATCWLWPLTTVCLVLSALAKTFVVCVYG